MVKKGFNNFTMAVAFVVAIGALTVNQNPSTVGMSDPWPPGGSISVAAASDPWPPGSPAKG